MIEARRLGHVTLSTPDIDCQVDYYVQIIGLCPVVQKDDWAVLTTAQGQEAIVLERAAEARLVGTSFEIAPDIDIKAVSRALTKAGIKSEIRSNVTPGVDHIVSFEDPAGTRVDIFSNYKFAPEMPYIGTIAPLKLGHIANRVIDVHKQVKFYTEILGFRVSDWRTDVFAFLRCCADHHTVNFLTHGEPGLHHIAFEVKDWGEINRACDHIAKNKLALEWGPARHVIGHNIACYHRNPDGLLMELFCELDRMPDEALGYFDPRPWHQDRPQRPRIWGPEWPRNYWNGEIAPWAKRNLDKVN